MRRRQIVAGLSLAAAMPTIAARGQQPAMPIVAYLSSGNSAAGREKQIDGLLVHPT
jgi:hypothetical protein